MNAYDAIVLAGGGARRLGGADKPGVRVGGRALLDRVLHACGGARATVVVAEPRRTARPVVWAREEPPGGGPLAALEAGIRGLESAPAPVAESVLVLSADLPFLGEHTVRGLLDALESESEPGGANGGASNSAIGGADSSAIGGVNNGAIGGAANRAIDGALLADGDGRDQPLVAVYRYAALRRVLGELAAEHGDLNGLPLRLLTRNLSLTRIIDPVASFDCDTWDDIAAARSRIREHGRVLDEWITAAKNELGIDLDVDTGVLLDLARDAAHGVARPAAPLTTFLVGYAAAQAGGGPEAVASAAAKAAELANRWAQEADSEPESDAKPDAG
ncbi:DUF6457 domain-containing protein [Streptomyces endophyticus]|uniref:DUF6457 domain-containing protein n=1 Tax=Streptomyces endophyticus TaxID=714166 RepID=A0ABU6FFK0_9ACTN|nr:DUF6457 domain-containing protein [Streptomyces endophyticus]MEB8342804.1 DUF6457 domain-containing protein [Streptomyces endophyticus]